MHALNAFPKDSTLMCCIPLCSAFSYTVFYSFIKASECTYIIKITVVRCPVPISIYLCQSKTDPFRQGHVITIQATSIFTCPV